MSTLLLTLLNPRASRTRYTDRCEKQFKANHPHRAIPCHRSAVPPVPVPAPLSSFSLRRGRRNSGRVFVFVLLHSQPCSPDLSDALRGIICLPRFDSSP